MTSRFSFLQNAMSVWFPTPVPEDDEAYERALIDAVLRNQPHRLEALLAAKPSYAVTSYVSSVAKLTLLHMASSTGSVECVNVLIRRGADINAVEKSGSSPLHLAARNGHKAVVQTLMNAGADIHRLNVEGFTALHWVASNGHTDIVRFLVEHGGQLEVLDNNGYTPLHMACQNGHVEVVRYLIDRGSNVHILDKQKRSPMFFACRYGQTECLRLLIKSGAQSTSDTKGDTPLHWAIAGNYRDCVLLLFKAFPALSRKLASIASAESIDEAVIVKVYHQLSHDGFHPVILHGLAEAAGTTGQSLLCLNPEVTNLEPVFLRQIRIVTKLADSWQPAIVDKGKGKAVAQPSDQASRAGASVTPGSVARRIPQPRKPSPVLPVTPDGGASSSASASASGALLASSSALQTPSSLSSDSTPNMGLGEATPSMPDANEAHVRVPSSRDDEEDLVLTASAVGRKGKEPDRSAGQASETTPTSAASSAFATASVAGSSSLAGASSSAAGASSSLATPQSASSAAGPAVADGFAKLFAGTDVDAVMNGFVDHVDANPLPTVQGIQGEPSYVQRAFDELEALWGTMERLLEFLQLPQSEDHVPLYLDKMAVVIHGFYICCLARDKVNQPPTRFADMITRHGSVLKAFIKVQSTVLFKQFHFMLDHVDLMAPFIDYVRAMPFETRRSWFYENLSNNHPEPLYDDLTSFLLVSRSSVLENTCEQLSTINIDTLKQSLNVRFHGEAGQGPGVRREWFDILTREILNPNYALFKPSADGATVQPNPDSYINPDHLNFFRFAGRVIGLALFHRQVLDVYFTRSFYKHILGLPVSYEDVESINPVYHKNLQWLLDNEISDLQLELTFSMEDNAFGYTTVIELKRDGSKIAVTDKNKHEYVQLVAERIMTSAISHQITAFLEGFHEIVPHSLIAMFDEFELELLISGMPELDIEDWQKNTEYIQFDATSPQIIWFWEIVSEFSRQDKVLLLQFVTGSSRVPMGGFVNLLGAEGPMKFTISKLEVPEQRLPTASTCFNLLKMPAYSSKENLQQRLMLALRYGSKGFEFA